jgi:hypothetical protein
MPVRKFRGVEDMSAPHWREPGDPEIVRAMAALWDIALRTSRRRFPPGIHRHASIEDMHRTQERWASEDSTR